MRRIKRDYGSFPCIIEIMILDKMWLGEFFWGRSVNVTLEKEEEHMEVECTPIIAMENG